MTLTRARGLVLFVALAAFLNSLGNGFAYDDNAIIVQNPVVTHTEWKQALLGRYWQEASAGTGLYRPVTVAAFAAEWRLFSGNHVGFHAVNVVLNAVVSLLVLALLLRFVPLPAALAGALFFAVHPVHVEAVANVVGQAELLAALAVLLACLLYLDGSEWTGTRHTLRLGGLALLYLLGLGAKEIAVTLPGLLFLLELFRASDEPFRRRFTRELPVYLGLTAVLGGYLLLRWSVLGTVVGEVPAPSLIHLSSLDRVLTSFTLWPEYLRLMVFPRVLSADYAPAVLLPATSMSADVWLGLVVLGVAGAVAWWARKHAPALSLGLLWFGVAVLPVCDLIVPTGILLAERTLFLPSVGAAFALAGVVTLVVTAGSVRERWALGTVGVLAGLALFIRTVDRNPTWLSSYIVFDTLATEHPESYRSFLARGNGLRRVGQLDEAAQQYEMALRLTPHNYALKIEVADFYGRRRQYGRATEILRSAIADEPRQPVAYRVLAEQLIRRGDAHRGFLMALRGITRAAPTSGLWAAVSEAYVAKGDLEAATRARRAALSLDPRSHHDWERLAELLAALHRPDQAAAARARAAALPPEEAGGAHGDLDRISPTVS